MTKALSKLAPEKPAAPENSNDARVWTAARIELEPAVLDMLAKGYGDPGKLRAAWSFFTEKGGSGAYREGMKTVPGMRKLLALGDAAEQSAAETDIPADMVPFVRTRLQWAKARLKLRSEIMKLQSAILAVCQGEEFEPMEAETKKLFLYLDVLDTRLEATLEQMVMEPDGSRRDALKDQAGAVVADYLAALDSGFFADVDTDNGFTAVSVRSTAISALSEVEAVLKKPVAAPSGGLEQPVIHFGRR